jgi:hypothetical protein
MQIITGKRMSLLAELSPTVASQPALGLGIKHIVGAGPDKQMLWINAVGIVACMASVVTLRHLYTYAQQSYM